MKKFLALLLAAVMTLSLVGCGGGSSENKGNDGAFPSNTITLYCGYSAGGSSDVVCRVLAEKLTKKLGVSVIVENVTGSGGWVLWTQMLENTDADGYSICMVNTPNWNLGSYDTANPRDNKYDDLDLLCNWISDYNCLVVRADDDRFTDWDSFVSYWKAGNKLLTSASAVGIMSDDNTMATRLAEDLGCEFECVQTNGASENTTMLLNGSTDFMVCNVSDAASSHLNGEYKILTVFAPERDSNLSDVPTYKELTGTELIGDSCRGFALPKGVDEAVRTTIMDAMRECINDEETMKQMADMYTNVNYLEGDDYLALMDQRVDEALAAYGRTADKK